MRPLTTCLAKPGRAPAPASPLAGSPRHPRRSVSRHAIAPPQPALRTAGKGSRAAPSVEAQPELVGVEQGGAGGGAGAANGYSNNVVAVDTALMPSAPHTLPVRPQPVPRPAQPPAGDVSSSLVKHKQSALLSAEQCAECWLAAFPVRLSHTAHELRYTAVLAALAVLTRELASTHTPSIRLACSLLCASLMSQAPPAGGQAAPMTTAMACELANAHAPYMQARKRSHLRDWLKAPT